MPFSYFPDSFTKDPLKKDFQNEIITYVSLCGVFATLPADEKFTSLIETLSKNPKPEAKVLLAQTHSLYALSLALRGEKKEAGEQLAKAIEEEQTDHGAGALNESIIFDKTSTWNKIIFHTAKAFSLSRYEPYTSLACLKQAHALVASLSEEAREGVTLELTLFHLWFHITRHDTENVETLIPKAVALATSLGGRSLPRAMGLIGCWLALFPGRTCYTVKSETLLKYVRAGNEASLKAYALKFASLPTTSPDNVNLASSPASHIRLLPSFPDDFIQKIIVNFQLIQSITEQTAHVCRIADTKQLLAKINVIFSTLDIAFNIIEDGISASMLPYASLFHGQHKALISNLFVYSYSNALSRDIPLADISVLTAANELYLKVSESPFCVLSHSSELAFWNVYLTRTREEEQQKVLERITQLADAYVFSENLTELAYKNINDTLSVLGHHFINPLCIDSYKQLAERATAWAVTRPINDLNTLKCIFSIITLELDYYASELVLLLPSDCFTSYHRLLNNTLTLFTSEKFEFFFKNLKDIKSHTDIMHGIILSTLDTFISTKTAEQQKNIHGFLEDLEKAVIRLRYIQSLFPDIAFTSWNDLIIGMTKLSFTIAEHASPTTWEIFNRITKNIPNFKILPEFFMGSVSTVAEREQRLSPFEEITGRFISALEKGSLFSLSLSQLQESIHEITILLTEPDQLIENTLLPSILLKLRALCEIIEDRVLYDEASDFENKNAFLRSIHYLACLTEEYQKYLGATDAHSPLLQHLKAFFAKPFVSENRLMDVIAGKLSALAVSISDVKEELDKITHLISSLPSSHSIDVKPFIFALDLLNGRALLLVCDGLGSTRKELQTLLAKYDQKHMPSLPKSLEAFSSLYKWLQKQITKSDDHFFAYSITTFELRIMAKAKAVAETLDIGHIDSKDKLQRAFSSLQGLQHARNNAVLSLEISHDPTNRTIAVFQNAKARTPYFEAVINLLDFQLDFIPIKSIDHYNSLIEKASNYQKNLSLSLMEATAEDLGDWFSRQVSSFYNNYLYVLAYPLLQPSSNFPFNAKAYETLCNHLAALLPHIPHPEYVNATIRLHSVVLFKAFKKGQLHSLTASTLITWCNTFLSSLLTMPLEDMSSIEHPPKEDCKELALLSLSYLEYLRFKGNDAAFSSLSGIVRSFLSEAFSPFYHASLLALSPRPLNKENALQLLDLTIKCFNNKEDHAPLAIPPLPFLREDTSPTHSPLAPAYYLYAMRDALQESLYDETPLLAVHIKHALLGIYSRLFTYSLSYQHAQLDTKIPSEFLHTIISSAHLLVTPGNRETLLTAIHHIIVRSHTRFGAKEARQIWKDAAREKLQTLLPSVAALSFTSKTHQQLSILLLIEELSASISTSAEINLTSMLTKAELKATVLLASHYCFISYAEKKWDTATYWFTVLLDHDRDHHATYPSLEGIVQYCTLIDHLRDDVLTLAYVDDDLRKSLVIAGEKFALEAEYYPKQIEHIQALTRIYETRDVFIKELTHAYHSPDFAFAKKSKSLAESWIKDHPSFAAAYHYLKLMHFLCSKNREATLDLDTTTLRAEIACHIGNWKKVMPDVHTFILATYDAFLALAEARISDAKTAFSSIDAMKDAFGKIENIEHTQAQSAKKRIEACYTAFATYVEAKALLSACHKALEEKEWETLKNHVAQLSIVAKEDAESIYFTEYQLLIDSQSLHADTPLKAIKSVHQKLALKAHAPADDMSSMRRALHAAFKSEEARLAGYITLYALFEQLEKIPVQQEHALQKKLTEIEKFSDLSPEQHGLLAGYKLYLQVKMLSENSPLSEWEACHHSLLSFKQPTPERFKKVGNTLTELLRSIQNKRLQMQDLANFKQAITACDQAVTSHAMEQVTGLLTALFTGAIPRIYLPLVQGYQLLVRSFSIDPTDTASHALLRDQLEAWNYEEQGELAPCVSRLKAAIRTQTASFSSLITKEQQIQKALYACDHAVSTKAWNLLASTLKTLPECSLTPEQKAIFALYTRVSEACSLQGSVSIEILQAHYTHLTSDLTVPAQGLNDEARSRLSSAILQEATTCKAWIDWYEGLWTLYRQLGPLFQKDALPPLASFEKNLKSMKEKPGFGSYLYALCMLYGWAQHGYPAPKQELTKLFLHVRNSCVTFPSHGFGEPVAFDTAPYKPAFDASLSAWLSQLYPPVVGAFYGLVPKEGEHHLHTYVLHYWQPHMLQKLTELTIDETFATLRSLFDRQAWKETLDSISETGHPFLTLIKSVANYRHALENNPFDKLLITIWLRTLQINARMASTHAKRHPHTSAHGEWIKKLYESIETLSCNYNAYIAPFPMTDLYSDWEMYVKHLASVAVIDPKTHAILQDFSGLKCEWIDMKIVHCSIQPSDISTFQNKVRAFGQNFTASLRELPAEIFFMLRKAFTALDKEVKASYNQEFPTLSPPKATLSCATPSNENHQESQDNASRNAFSFTPPSFSPSSHISHALRRSPSGKPPSFS